MSETAAWVDQVFDPADAAGADRVVPDKTAPVAEAGNDRPEHAEATVEAMAEPVEDNMGSGARVAVAVRAAAGAYKADAAEVPDFGALDVEAQAGPEQDNDLVHDPYVHNHWDYTQPPLDPPIFGALA